MKQVKVKVLLPFVSGKTSFGGGDEISLDQDVAYKLAKKLVVEFKTKKEFSDLDSKIIEEQDQAKAKAAEDEAKVNAIIRESHIQNELNELYEQVALKEAELNGEVLSDDDLQNAIESISKRETLVSKKTGKK